MSKLLITLPSQPEQPQQQQARFHVARNSFARAKRARAAATKGAPGAAAAAQPEASLLLTDCRVLDAESGTTSASTSVLVRRGKVVAVGALAQPPPDGAEYVHIECAGKVLMPGRDEPHACTAWPVRA